MKKLRMAWSRSEKKHRNSLETETEFGFEVESLESRTMLAGNVHVIVSGDNMIINGDSDSNEIMVYSLVDTIGVLGGNGTTVTGDVFDLTTADLNKLTIKMKSGDDHVTVGPRIEATGKVRIIGGGGDDQITVQGTFNDKVTVNGGADSDFIQLYLGTFNDKVTLNGGAGDDNVTIQVTTFATDVKANMGHGSDVVRLTAGVSFAEARFNLGGGDDLLVMVDSITGEPIFNGGSGFDRSNPDPVTSAQNYPNVTLKSFETGN